jgi:2-polyprenyl-6-hydroxyphenyl methylase/3-demethylubiquinone-9 3-methyltransferase
MMQKNPTALSAASIDPKEVAYYERMAALWWTEDGPFWPLHRLNTLRVEYLRKHICRHFQCDATADQPLQGLRILDIGCGGGILSEAMTRLGARVTGVDVVEKNIHIARLHALQSGLNIDYRADTAEALAGSGEQFDMVLNMEVVEHVADLPGFMQACTALVRPGGLMSVATINRTPIAWLVAIVGAEYVLRWLPKGTHEYHKLRRPPEVIAPLEDAGFTVLAQTGVRVNPFKRSLHLTAFMGVNYMLVATRSTQT